MSLNEILKRIKQRKENQALEALDHEFENFSKLFRRRGNKFRQTYDGNQITVFCREGEWNWRLNPEDEEEEPYFGEGGFESSDEAIESVAEELGVGSW